MDLNPLRNVAVAALAAASLSAGGSTGSTALAAERPGGTRYVLLVRHGHYDRVDSLDDRTGNALSPLGHEQSRLLGDRLAVLSLRPGRFVSSDLLRAVETAREIGARIGRSADRDSLLAECAAPSSRPGFDATHDAKDLAACQATMEAVWAKYFKPSAADEHDLLVCHGNVIRWLVNRALGNDTRHWTSLDIANASLTVIAVRPDGGTRLVAYSDAGHLPVDRQTWAGLGLGVRSSTAPAAGK